MGKLYTVLTFCALTASVLASCKKHNDAAADLPSDPQTAVESKPPLLTAVTNPINNVVGGYYVSTPALYDYTTKSYPLIIFLSGGGQYGNGKSDLPLLLNDGMAKLVANNQFPAAFSVNGQTWSFIIFTPQLSTFPTDAQLNDILVYARAHYRVDSTRIYVSGLSVGGTMTSTMGGEFYSHIAAIVPISGEDITYEICQSIAFNNVPVWVFHNLNDPKTPSDEATEFVKRINNYNPVTAPRLTLFPDYGHDAWTQALSPTYKEQGKNVYEWMLQYTRK